MFENLQAYYEYLEKDNSLLLDYNTSNLLIQLRDKTDDKELKSHCSYEMFFTDYTMNSGEIRPKISYPNGESYPNFSLFDDDLDYIKKRAESVKNPKYKAKYNHLLWESKHKHNDYAKQAIENYFSFLQNASFPIDDNLSHHSFENYFKNLFTLSQTINHKRDEAIQFFVSLLGSNKINGYKEYSLMKFIAEEGKKIEPNTLQTFFDYSKKITDNSTYPDFTGEYLQLLVILCQKLNVSPKPYHNKLAEFHIAQSAKHKESFVIHDFYLKALAQYQKAVNKEKIEEVTVLIEKAKRNINFKSVKVEHTDEMLQQWWETIKKQTGELIEKGESKDIYTYIMLAKIFPKADVLDQEVRPVMYDLVSVMTFDINKNIGKKEKSGINPYFIHIIISFDKKKNENLLIAEMQDQKISYSKIIKSSVILKIERQGWKTNSKFCLRR